MQYVSNLSKVCAASRIRPEMGKVFFGEGVIVATDGYKLVELKSEGSVNALIDPKLLKKGDVVTRADDDSIVVVRGQAQINIGPQDGVEGYPGYTKCLDENLAAEGYECRVNRKYLADLLNAIPDDLIDLRVPKEQTRAVVVTAASGVGLLMPVLR